MDDLQKRCEQAVHRGDVEQAGSLAREALRRDVDPTGLIENGFARGMREIGRRWAAGEAFLPDVAFSAEAMRAALDVLGPEVAGSSRGPTVVVGTVAGDIHDIGKTLVGILLSAHGYDVVDLGVDVADDAFLGAVEDGAAVVGMSALLTTTMPCQRRVVEELGAAGLRDRVKVLVGGAPTSAEWARRIGADGYAENALEAVRVVHALTDREGAAT